MVLTPNPHGPRITPLDVLHVNTPSKFAGNAGLSQLPLPGHYLQQFHTELTYL